MYRIKKMKETMTSKERVIRTFYYDSTDRVPIDYMANPGVHKRLCKALGVPVLEEEQLLQALGVDYREIKLSHCGKDYFPQKADRIVNPIYGYYTRWIENECGGYEDYCDFPLKNAEEEVIRNFPVPSPEDFDYRNVYETCKRYQNYAVYVGNPGFADIINSTGRVMGMEDTLVNLLTEDEATLDYIHRKVNLEFGVMERALDKAKGGIDFIWLGEDLGTQIAPMISLDLYRSIIKPVQKKFVELADSYKIPVMVHSCGSSSWAYEDFIEIGIKAVDTLQPEAVNMSPAYLKEHFHKRLSFHGCISTAGALAYGTADEVEKVCRETLDIMAAEGGYHFAPTHMIQDNTPVENIVAMYQTAHAYLADR